MMSATTIKFITDALTVERNSDRTCEYVCWACEESAPACSEGSAAFLKEHKNCRETE